MTWTLRIQSQMLDQIRQDLERPHAHAAERVGFVYVQMGNVGGPELQILPVRYAPVRDEDYLEDFEVGAKIGSAAIRQAMQTSLSDGVGVFHVHMHEHKGRPRFSSVDIQAYPDLVRGFQNISRTLAHGALLLSRDSVECLVWMPGAKRPADGGRVVITGRPMGFFPVTGGLYA